MLFFQALLGWDITSRLNGLGKVAALKKEANYLHFRKQAKVFDLHSQIHRG